jgi:hypothetical protein
MPQTDLLTEREAAAVLRCSTRKLQRDRAEGRGCAYVRIDWRIFYRRQDIDRYIAEHICGGELRERKERPLMLESWYEERVKNWPSGQKSPSEDDDRIDARAQFPELGVTREQIRELRAKYAPETWKAQGRRPDCQDPKKLAEKLAKKRPDK